MKKLTEMKNSTLKGILIALLITGVTQLYAQTPEYKIDANSGRVVFKEIHSIEFQGHSGSGLIIKKNGEDNEVSERAKGLKLINGLGLVDNTGVGLSMTTEEGTKTIQQVSTNSDNEYLVMVPKGVTIVYEHSSPHGDDVIFKDISSELEVTTNHSDVTLENVTGPMTINTVHGDIEGGFSAVNQSNPISIVSSHGDIDLGIPATTKALLKISTGWGEIYSDLDIKVDNNESSMKKYSANSVQGTINGGGVEMSIKSSHGSIYLRKK